MLEYMLNISIPNVHIVCLFPDHDNTDKVLNELQYWLSNLIV